MADIGSILTVADYSNSRRVDFYFKINSTCMNYSLNTKSLLKD